MKGQATIVVCLSSLFKKFSMNLLFLWCIIGLCWKLAILQSCPVGFEQEPASGRCFFAVTGSFSWSSAYSSCNSSGAILARINSGNISSFVSNHMLTNKTNVFWIGLTDLAVEGVFRWLTNEFPMWNHWDAGFPQYSSLANCVWVNSSKSLLWRDADCSELHGFICEYIVNVATIPTDPVLTGQCLKAQPAVSNFLAPCWKLYLSSLTWNQSKAYCESTFGALVTPSAGNVQSVINETAAHNLDSYWIGLSTQTIDENLRLQTTTCVPGWTNWANPSYNAGGKCVIGNSSLGHHWKLTSCNELHSFLCDYQLGLNCSLPPALPPNTVLLDLDAVSYPFMVAYYGCQSGYNLASGESYNYIVCNNCGQWTAINSDYCAAIPTKGPPSSTKKAATTMFSITSFLPSSAAVTATSALTTRTSQLLTTVIPSTTKAPTLETTSPYSTSATSAATVQSTFQTTTQATTLSTPQTMEQIATQSAPQTTTQNAPQTMEQTIIQSTPQTMEPTSSQSLQQTTKLTTTIQSTPQTTEQTTIQSTAQTTEQTTIQSTAQTMEQTTIQTSAQTTEQTTIQSTAQTTEQTTIQSTAQTTEQTTIQSSAQTTEQTTTLSAPQTMAQAFTTGTQSDETAEEAETSATTCHTPAEKTTVLDDCMQFLTSVGIGIHINATEESATVSSTSDDGVTNVTADFTTTGFVRTQCNVLPEFSSMISNYSNSSIGSVVEFACRGDLTFPDLTHVKLARCNESGRWDPPIEYCAKSITKTFRSEAQPLEAPGSVGIGSVALIICILEMVGLLVLDLDLYFKNLKLLYRNLCHGRKPGQQNHANF